MKFPIKLHILGVTMISALQYLQFSAFSDQPSFTWMGADINARLADVSSHFAHPY